MAVGHQTHHRTAGELFFGAVLLVERRLRAHRIHRRNGDVLARRHIAYLQLDALQMIAWPRPAQRVADRPLRCHWFFDFRCVRPIGRLRLGRGDIFFGQRTNVSGAVLL